MPSEASGLGCVGWEVFLSCDISALGQCSSLLGRDCLSLTIFLQDPNKRLSWDTLHMLSPSSSSTPSSDFLVLLITALDRDKRRSYFSQRDSSSVGSISDSERRIPDSFQDFFFLIILLSFLFLACIFCTFEV